jgi:hypothetical protein
MATTRERRRDVSDEADAAADRFVDTIADISSEAGDRLTVVAGSAGDVMRDADRSLRQSSDQTLAIVGGVALGFSGGLLMSGAHRLLVILSMFPVVLVALAAMERLDATGRRSDAKEH